MRGGRLMLSLKNVVITLTLQAASVCLSQFASTAKKFLDIFLAQATFLNIAALATTAVYSIFLYFIYVWLANRWSPRFALSLIISLMTVALLVLSIFILPYWKYSPQELVMLSHKACSWQEHLKTLIVAAPFIKTHALLSIYSVFGLTFAFWQAINSSIKPKIAKTWYPLFTLSFGALHYGAQKLIALLLSKTAGAGITYSNAFLPMCYCILALTPALLILISCLYSLSPPTQTSRLHTSALSMLKECLCNTKIRAFAITNILGIAAIGLLMTFMLDLNELAQQKAILTPNHWPSFNTVFVWSLLGACALISYVVMRLFSPAALLRFFALFLTILGLSMAFFLPSSTVPTTLIMLYGVLSVKGCKHALFTTPKQVIYAGWDPEHQFKIKAFFDMCLDRLSFFLGAFAYMVIKAVQIEYGYAFYPLLGGVTAGISLLMFLQARSLR